MRRTLKTAVTFHGIGMHGGLPVTMTVAPAAAHAGIDFLRTDAGPAALPVPARYDGVIGTHLCTRLANSDGIAVSTVEHLMAALAGCGISDARITLDSPEVPAMDGSAVVFVREFLRAGIRGLGVPWRSIRVLEPIRVRIENRIAELSPAPCFEMEFDIHFSDPAIGRQYRKLALTGGAVISELSDSRTFGFLVDIAELHRAGLGRGSCLDNAIVIDDGRVLNYGGLRQPDEVVRHKMLDAVGDLALAGAPIIGRYTGIRAGHEISNMLLRKMFFQPKSWTWCDYSPGRAPGGVLCAPPVRVSYPPIAV
jgi:UDP-3-O-[3-hydroxymyristoyl] N-acetylglucosamine deacetylase